MARRGRNGNNWIEWLAKAFEEGTTLFVGEFTHSDSKGRVTIPSKWRIPGGDNTYLALPNPGG